VFQVLSLALLDFWANSSHASQGVRVREQWELVAPLVLNEASCWDEAHHSCHAALVVVVPYADVIAIYAPEYHLMSTRGGPRRPWEETSGSVQ